MKLLKDIMKNYLDEDNVNILIVGHNAILRCLILSLIGKPNKGFRKIRLENHVTLDHFTLWVNMESTFM